MVDAKVPLDAQLDALTTDDPEEAAAHLRRHVRQVRTHVDALSGKAYWRSLPTAPEFVVMFVPAESFLAAALDTDPSLLAYAATKDVVIATPTTLIALLRTIAHGWTTEALAERTREIHELGRELHTRIGVMGGHLDKVGRSLKALDRGLQQRGRLHREPGAGDGPAVRGHRGRPRAARAGAARRPAAPPAHRRRAARRGGRTAP